MLQILSCHIIRHIWPVLFFLTVLVDAAAAQPVEYLLKAGFIEKFARFIDWPGESGFQDAESPFVISVIGESPFRGSLEKIYGQGRIKGKQVSINYIQTVDEIAGSHVLFICASERKNLPRILETAGRHPVLVVSDTRGFVREGTHINLYITEKGTLHFEINVKAVKQSGLSVQLALLEVAKI